jgi:hypothetical protein
MIRSIKEHFERQQENLEQIEEFLNQLLKVVKDNKDESEKM